jgi:hypothetical protein
MKRLDRIKAMHPRPSGLAYRRPGRAVDVTIGKRSGPATVVRNIYAKPDLTRPTLCEVRFRNGSQVIVPSRDVKVIL